MSADSSSSELPGPSVLELERLRTLSSRPVSGHICAGPPFARCANGGHNTLFRWQLSLVGDAKRVTPTPPTTLAAITTYAACPTGASRKRARCLDSTFAAIPPDTAVLTISPLTADTACSGLQRDILKSEFCIQAHESDAGPSGFAAKSPIASAAAGSTTASARTTAAGLPLRSSPSASPLARAASSAVLT